MRSSSLPRKVVGAASAAVVSLLLLGGAAVVTADSAGHGITQTRTISMHDGHGI